VVSGKADIELSNEKRALQGPGMYQFNTLLGITGPVALKKVPEWVTPPANPSENVKNLHAAVEKLRRDIADKGATAALAKARSSAEKPLREVAAYSGPALDNLAAGIAALKDEKAKGVRVAGIGALFHYIGRDSAADVGLYEALVADKIKPGQASIIMELLHGMSTEARLRPETYDALITYLQSDHIGVRELAAMNLYALVPAGRKIAFDAAGTVQERASAQAAWRKLIPEGQVPKNK
jgi:hypothetical protein